MDSKNNSTPVPNEEPEAPPAYSLDVEGLGISGGSAGSGKLGLGGSRGEETVPFITVRDVDGLDTRINVITSQPTARTMMSISSGGPNPRNLPVDEKGQRSWSHGLFDCFGDAGFCCLATFCTPCAYGKNKSRLDWLNASGNPHPNQGRIVGTDCGLHFLCASVFGMWGPAFLQTATHRSVRNRYSIRGNILTDCLTAAFCAPCQLTQEHRELLEEEAELRGESEQGGGGRIRLPVGDEDAEVVVLGV